MKKITVAFLLSLGLGFALNSVHAVSSIKTALPKTTSQKMKNNTMAQTANYEKRAANKKAADLKKLEAENKAKRAKIKAGK